VKKLTSLWLHMSAPQAPLDLAGGSSLLSVMKEEPITGALANRLSIVACRAGMY
jgi:hypothetical protein